MGLSDPCAVSYSNNCIKSPNFHYQTLSLQNRLKASQSIDDEKCNWKINTLYTIFHEPTGETNTYTWFVYGPQKIFNHNQGKVSESMNADTVNVICMPGLT